jgi:hypothetical protein
VPGFVVPTFGTAFLGALIISLVMSRSTGQQGRPEEPTGLARRSARKMSSTSEEWLASPAPGTTQELRSFFNFLQCSRRSLIRISSPASLGS